MDAEYFWEARRVRDLAEKADPFTKKRLLTLAEHYDIRARDFSGAVRLNKPPTPIPAAGFGKADASEPDPSG
jgi:hypothetical protein